MLQRTHHKSSAAIICSSIEHHADSWLMAIGGSVLEWSVRIGKLRIYNSLLSPTANGRPPGGRDMQHREASSNRLALEYSPDINATRSNKQMALYKPTYGRNEKWQWTCFSTTKLMLAPWQVHALSSWDPYISYFSKTLDSNTRQEKAHILVSYI